MLKDSTQNRLNWHKPQLVFPARPWLYFFRGPGKVYTPTLPSGMTMATVQQGNALILLSCPYDQYVVNIYSYVQTAFLTVLTSPLWIQNQ